MIRAYILCTFSTHFAPLTLSQADYIHNMKGSPATSSVCSLLATVFWGKKRSYLQKWIFILRFYHKSGRNKVTRRCSRGWWRAAIFWKWHKRPMITMVMIYLKCSLKSAQPVYMGVSAVWWWRGSREAEKAGRAEWREQLLQRWCDKRFIVQRSLGQLGPLQPLYITGSSLLDAEAGNLSMHVCVSEKHRHRERYRNKY